MERLDGLNLFVSEFVVGSNDCVKEYTKTDTYEISVLQKWLHKKDNDLALKRYHSDKTISVCFLEIIELELFKEITYDLVNLFKNDFPYSTKKDFLQYTFSYTIHDLEKFIKRENYHDYGITVDSNRYRFVYHRERNGGHIEFLDFVIDINKHVEHYKQYYKKVLEFINEFDFDKQNISANKEETKTKNEDAEPLNDMDNQYPSNDNSSTESKLEVPEPSVETIRSQTKEIIIDKINLIDKSKHWRYVFKTEKDFILYTELLTKFFEYKEYELPKVTMILRARCKTRFANTLGEIHLELSNRDTLAGDTKYFEIIRTLKPFKKSTNASLYKDLTRFSRD